MNKKTKTKHLYHRRAKERSITVVKEFLYAWLDLSANSYTLANESKDSTWVENKSFSDPLSLSLIWSLLSVSISNLWLRRLNAPQHSRHFAFYDRDAQGRFSAGAPKDNKGWGDITDDLLSSHWSIFLGNNDINIFLTLRVSLRWLFLAVCFASASPSRLSATPAALKTSRNIRANGSRSPFPPISALFLVRTPTQSAVQDENLDQLVSWQSSWQGSWHRWVMAGMALANFRHSLMSACVPSSWRHDTAGRIGHRDESNRLR